MKSLSDAGTRRRCVIYKAGASYAFGTNHHGVTPSRPFSRMVGTTLATAEAAGPIAHRRRAHFLPALVQMVSIAMPSCPSGDRRESTPLTTSGSDERIDGLQSGLQRHDYGCAIHDGRGRTLHGRRSSPATGLCRRAVIPQRLITRRANRLDRDVHGLARCVRLRRPRADPDNSPSG